MAGDFGYGRENTFYKAVILMFQILNVNAYGSYFRATDFEQQY